MYVLNFGCHANLLTRSKFSFLQSSDLDFPAAIDDDDVKLVSHEHLDRQLLEAFAALPKKAEHDDFGVVNVAPSVVPTYLPSFRVFSYNISGPGAPAAVPVPVPAVSKFDGQNPKQKTGKHQQKSDQCGKAKFRNSWRCRFTKPWNSDPDAPSRKNVLWTPLGYAQVRTPTENPACNLMYILSPSIICPSLQRQTKRIPPNSGWNT